MSHEHFAKVLRERKVLKRPQLLPQPQPVVTKKTMVELIKFTTVYLV